MSRFIDLPEAPDWQCGALDGARPLLRRGVTLQQAVGHLRGQLVYLASPYTKIVAPNGAWSPACSVVLAGDVAQWAGRLAAAGVTAVSPILQAHQMVWSIETPLDPLDADFWASWCAPLLAASSAVVVAPIEGWRESEGVWHELRMALGAVKPVWVLEG